MEFLDESLKSRESSTQIWDLLVSNKDDLILNFNPKTKIFKNFGKVYYIFK